MNWDKDKALESVGGDQELLDELIDLFVETTDTDISLIQQGLDTNDGVKAAEAAHSIKGSALALDFQEIREVSENIEKDSKSGLFTHTQENIQILTSLLNEVKALC